MQIIPRNQWAGDIKPRGTPGRIVTPAPRVWLHHGATGSSTIATARSYARYHIETRKWLDIGYSFLVAEGKVLEGRGAGRAGAHTSGDNDASHGICLVGNYQSSPLADRDLDALVWLLRHGHVQGWWSTAALTGGHRDAPGASTGCPGDGAYRLIPTINRRASQVPQEDDDMERVIKIEGDERTGYRLVGGHTLEELAGPGGAEAVGGPDWRQHQVTLPKAEAKGYRVVKR